MARNTPTSRFQDLNTEIPRRLIWRSWGPEKSGKNHFGLTAPGPIYGLYFDPGGLEGMAEKFTVPPLGPKEIKVIQYRFNKKHNTQEDAKAIKKQWLEDYEVALNRAKTIQIDETELWEVFRFAEFGRESARGREYGPLNGEYRGLIQDAYDAGINLQLIQKTKAEWVDDKPTGAMKPMGFQQAGNIVQVNLEHSWSLESGFMTTVVLCRQNMAISGEEYPELTFEQLGQLVYPDTSEEDWQ